MRGTVRISLIAGVDETAGMHLQKGGKNNLYYNDYLIGEIEGFLRPRICFEN